VDLRSRVASVVVIALLVGACSGTSSGTPPPGGGGASQPAATGGGGAGTGANGLPGSACGLLTAAEIQGIIGSPVQAGFEQDTDTQVGCDWNETSPTTPSAGIAVATYDDSLWQAGAQAGISTSVSGIGDAAFKGWPTPGTLNVKVKGYMVTVGVTDFVKDPAAVDAESLALAQLVLSRI
jgi:hypothetical protein